MSVWNDPYLDRYVAKQVQPDFVSKFVQVHPIFAMIAAREDVDKIGNPKSSVVFGVNNLPTVTRKRRAGGLQHEWSYQTTQTDAATAVEYRGDRPQATSDATDNFDTAAVRWFEFEAPVRVPKHDAVLAKNNGGTALGDVFADARKQGAQRIVEKASDALINGTLTSTQQTAKMWASMLGLDHTISDGTTTGETSYTHYAGKDRTIAANTTLAGLVVPVADFATRISGAGTKPMLDMFTYVNFVGSPSTETGALVHKHAGGANLIVVHPSMFFILQQEAESRRMTVYSAGNVPDVMAKTGFTNPVIEASGAMITWDPDCPQDTALMLNTSTWEFHVDPECNFAFTDWVDKAATEEGGRKHLWCNVEARCRLVCEQPFANAKITGLTTS